LKKVVNILVFLLFVFQSSGQKYSFISYSTKEGLAQSQVNEIVQDSQEYLWIATLDGLSKFNGKIFVNFYKKDGLLSNRILSLSVNNKDEIWAVTSEGISIVKRDTIVAFEHNKLFVEKEIVEIKHQENKLWIAITNEIYYFEINANGNYQLIQTFETPINTVKVRDILLDGNKVYVATNKGLYQIFNNKISLFSLPWELDIVSIGLTSIGKLWIGTLENGVYLYEKNYQLIVNQSNSNLLNNFTTKLTVDKNGNAWVCTNSALSEINQLGKVENYISKNGFDYIPELVFEDIEGNIWIGTNGKGLLKFANKQFKFLTRNESLPADLIISIAEDKDGNIWLGSLGEGISCISPDKIVSYNARKTNFPNNYCWVIHQDLLGDMWFGTSEGLARFTNNKFITFTKKEGLPDNKVQSIYQETAEIIWIGTRQGVCYFKDNIFTEIDDYPYRNTRSIVSTEDGIYWFGTSDGLVRYNGFDSQLIKDSLIEGVTIYSITTIGNKLWLATEKGLIYYDGVAFSQLYYSNDRDASTINFLTIDSEKKLWIGSNKGIFELDIESFLENKLTVNSFNTNNGLVGMETNLNSIFQDSKNNIWMGTNEGINVFKKTLEPKLEPYQPSVHFSNVRLFFEDKNYLTSLKMEDNFEFKHKQNTITFYFHFNYFKDPSKVNYSYLLEGSDETWSPMDETSFSRYPNLPHGKYTFKVKSTIDGEKWSDIEEISFEIKAPFWLTWWFRISVLIVLFLIIFYFQNRRRNSQQQEREVELLNYKNKLVKLEQQSLNASMNRHFIFNSLNSIQFYINKEDKLSANRYLSNFSKLIRKNLDTSSAEDNLIPLSEEIERLSLYLSLENMRFKERFTYEINKAPEVDSELTMVPAMFMQPFIENSIWHGILPMEKPGIISIDIFKKDNKTYFEIIDNGIGIEISIQNKTQDQNEHSSMGMKIATNRIELLQKVIQKEISINGPKQIMENGEVKGTKVIIIFG
jgi:ligand-binding sensor domain-containing protein